MMTTPWRNLARWCQASVSCALAAGTVAALALPAVAAPAAPSSPPVQAAFADPDATLGPGWRQSSDAIVTGVGDTEGFHIYVAGEKNAFRWSALATLGGPSEMGTWTGYTCVTGSGHYVAAVYAPTMVVNKPNLLSAGALAAIVDIRTGQVRDVAAGVALSYFNPSCGSGDRALFTRYLNPDRRDLEQTDLLSVDAATGRMAATRRVGAELTTPVPGADGDYGIAHGALVKVGATGTLTTVAKPTGQPFAVHATTSGIDLVSANGDQAVAQRYTSGRLVDLGTGARDRLQLFGLPGGEDALIGDVRGIAKAAGLRTISSDQPVDAVSEQGHVLVQRLLARQTSDSVRGGGTPALASDAGQVDVTVKAVRDNATSAGTVTASAPVRPHVATNSAVAGPHPLDSPPADLRQPACAVPRNNINRQVLQPSPNQVEWAVDMAVQGTLTIPRPANYSQAGEPAYTPQGMFPAPTNVRVPAQVMLGILAQESNMAQASWHAVPGDAGNPLVADYYGNGNIAIDSIDYSASDCGYGIAQVTDGMRATDTSRQPNQQVAIATDYAANIAAGLEILAEKWQQLQINQTTANNNDASKIENWWFAVWGYNSGVYPNDGSNGGNYGVGWLNNPANPIYPASRDYFLRDPGNNDAAHPADWSYEEKVMGWIENPQLDDTTPKYSQPIYHDGTDHMVLPDPKKRVFCWPSVNNCDPTVAQGADPCPDEDSRCWWHGNATFADCIDGQCSTEWLAYTTGGNSEPTLIRTYGTSCGLYTAPSGERMLMIDDMNDPSVNLLGCPGQARGGKFTLEAGYPIGDSYLTTDGLGSNVCYWSYYGQVDLHQLGAGYLGHMYFTHVYANDASDACGDLNSPAQRNVHQVVGTWIPNLTAAGRYQIMVHLPSHGADTYDAKYTIYTGPVRQDSPATCDVNQETNGADEWVSLGTYQLSPGSQVQLSNMVDSSSTVPSDGSVDIAFDAMAFINVPSSSSVPCVATG